MVSLRALFMVLPLPLMVLFMSQIVVITVSKNSIPPVYFSGNYEVPQRGQVMDNSAIQRLLRLIALVMSMLSTRIIAVS